MLNLHLTIDEHCKYNTVFVIFNTFITNFTLFFVTYATQNRNRQENKRVFL